MWSEHAGSRKRKIPSEWVQQPGERLEAQAAVACGARLHLGERSMFRARLAIPIAGVIAASLMLPGVASANTAAVTCDSTGVVFTYNADFGRSKVSTETVNGATYEYTV